MKGPKKDKLTGNFEDYLLRELQDPELASEYLNVAIEDGDIKVFLMALGDIVKAQGMTKIAKKAGVNRENAYRAVSKEGNPTIKSVAALIDAVGLRLVTRPIGRSARAEKASKVRSFEAVAKLGEKTEECNIDHITPSVESVSFDESIPYIPKAKAAYEFAYAA